MQARTYLAILHLLGLALVLLMVPSANGQWPMFHKDVRNSGVTGHDGSESDSTAWSYDISHSGWSSSEDLIWASPVVADTCVYVAARNGKVYCFGRTCGDSLWAADVSDTLSSTPCISDGYLYVLGGPTDRRVHCIDAADGDSIWASSQLGSSWYYGGGREAWMESSPVVVGDSVLFVGSRDGKVYCLDTDDGSEIWSTEIGLAVVSSPGYSAQENRLYVGSVEIPTHADSSAVVCLDADDGDPLWRYVYENGNDRGTMGSPLVVDSDDAVYVGANTV